MKRLFPLAIALALTLSACSSTSNTSKSSADASAAKKAASSDPFKPWKEVLKDTKEMEGQFDLHMKRDQTLFMEIQPDQLGEQFGFMSHFSKGTGVFNLHDGLSISSTRMMQFDRIGDKLYLRHINTRFTADEGSPMANSLADNVGHSIIGVFDIKAVHDSTKALAIDFTPFIVSDYMKIGDRMKPYFANRPVAFVKASSYVEQAMAFPENIEIDALLTYKATGASVTSSAGVTDLASIPVGVRYSFFALPEVAMTPRIADDRVGYFMDAQRDFSNDKNVDQMIRYINRWRLEKKDPAAAMSDPVKPIVYYIDRSVPHEYREWVRQGIEGWQKAYEAAGFSNAIIAMDAPDDSTWSAEDVRYATVRWSAAHEMGYAIGPSQKDPRSGEILNADVLLSSTFMLGWTNEWQNLVGETGMLTQMQKMEEQIAMMSGAERDKLCLFSYGKQHQMGMLQATLLADGIMNAVGEVPEEFYGPAIRDLVYHEVGHTLGLRHNFRGSAAIDYNRMQDKGYTSENGLTLSVMDYAGTNINPNREEQGHYVNNEVGSYDIWAIQFGYQQAPAGMDDAAFAESIARLSADPMHAYNTDGDTHLGPNGVDPLSNTWDLSSDPIAYARDQITLAGNIAPVIEERIIADGDSYSRLRSSMNGLMFAQFQQLGTVAKMVGGSHFSRDHKGTPDARLPFTPLPASEQREAVTFILENALDVDDMPFDASMLNKAAPNRQDDWNSTTPMPLDPAIHESVMQLQMNTLGTLLHRNRLRRMINAQLRTDDPYTVSELVESTTSAVFASLGDASISSFDRNIQIAYAEHLGGLMNNLRPSPSTPAAPAEAQALARLELTELLDDIDAAQSDRGKDRVTTAHLMQLKAVVEGTFDVEMMKAVK